MSERRGSIGRLIQRAPLLPEFAVIIGVLAMIWWATWATLAGAYRSSLAAAARDAANLAQVFEESTRRVIASGDQALLALREMYRHDPAHFDIETWSRRLWAEDWFTVHLDIAGPDGRSLRVVPGHAPIDFSDREHFQVHRDSQVDQLYISMPLMGRATGRSVIPLTRRILTEDGGFGGTVILSLGTEKLAEFYATLQLDHGSMTVVGLDGVVRAHAPGGEAVSGKGVEEAGLPAWVISEAPLDQRANGVTLSARRLARYPLVVVVALDDADTLAAYRAMRSSLCTKALLATVAILVAGAFWIKQRRRSIESQAELALTLERMGEGLVMVDDRGRVRVANERALELLGLPPSLLAVVQGPDGSERGLAEAELLAALDQQCAASRLRISRPERPDRFLAVNTSPFPEGGAVHVLADVTARHLAMERVHHLAMHDALTGLGNATLLGETIDTLLEVQPPRCALLVLRIHRFQRVRETLGQEASDQLLLQAVERLKLKLRPPDQLFRRSTEDFAVLCSRSEGSAELRSLARSLQAALEEPFLVYGQTVRLSLAIGLAPAAGSAGGTDLLRRADLACSEATLQPSAPILAFEPEMMARRQARLSLEDELRGAIEAGQLYLEYQPQFRVAGSALIGFEALVRWQHPVRGLIPPGDFIPIAEETGWIIELGRWVLQQACRAAASWPEHVRVAVNLSPVQFRDPALTQTVSRILIESGLPAQRLELEVTEGVLIHDEHEALDTFMALKRLGVRLALDDFGTGYSSASYLLKFPFERIKLDRSFVQAQVTDLRARVILQSLINMSAELGVDVIAEGVETRTQLTLLRQQGCLDVQGFLVGRPLLQEQAGCIAARGSAADAEGTALALDHEPVG